LKGYWQFLLLILKKNDWSLLLGALNKGRKNVMGQIKWI